MKNKSIKFEYGENIELEKYVVSWEKGENYGGYCITAPSGYGKTTLLKELASQLPNTEYIAGYSVLEKLYEDARNGRPIDLAIGESSEVVLIDHLDELKGKECTMSEICRIIRNNELNKVGEKRLIICTFIDERAAQDFAEAMNYERIYLRAVKPNRRIVREMARDLAVKLTEKQISDFANSGDMYALRMAFRDIERDLFLGKKDSE